MSDVQDSKKNDRVDEAYARLQDAFAERLCTPTSFRIEQLKKLAWAITENKEAILQALYDDLGQGALEAEVTQYNSSIWICTEYIATLESLSKTQHPRAVHMPFPLYQTAVHRVPLGPALIISPFNYCYKLAIEPFVTAIAAGCPALLKPAEITPHTNRVLRKIIDESLDKRCYAMIEGEADVVERLLLNPWGRVLFTGSSRVGRLVAIACAKTFTPCALELGGKCPSIIDSDFDIELAAKRTLVYTTMRCSQTCVTSDYTLIHPSKQARYIDAALALLKEWYPEGELKSPSYGKLPTSAMVDRINRLLDSTKGTIVRRGEVDKETNQIGISIVCDVQDDDALMQEEIFGPILVIKPCESIEAAVRYVNAQPSPLGIYVFSHSKSITSYVFDRTQSGSFLINDCAQQALIDHLPFGGVGQSGHGSCHGKWGFDLFTQDRPKIAVPTWLEVLLSSRYPPFTEGKRKLLNLTFLPVALPFAKPGTKGVAWIKWWVGRKGYKAVVLLAVIAGLRNLLKRYAAV